MTFSADWYDLTIDDAIQGQDPGNVLDACAETLDPVACSNIDRSASGAVGLVYNRLVNIGSIEASGLDLGLNYLAPVTGIGQFDVRVNATYLDNYTEITNNADGTQTVNDLTGTITDQTFQRAFPEWRANTRFGWTLEQWNAGITFRYVDSVVQPSGDILSSRTFTDARLSYAFSPDGEGFTIAIGANNIFNKDPAVCLNTCGSINMSPVLHDLPGTFGYLRLTYRH